MNIPDEFGLFPFQRFTADELRHFFVWCAAHKVSDVDLTGGSPVSVSRFGRRVRCSSATLPTTLMSSLIDELFGREVIPRVLAGNPVDRTIQINGDASGRYGLKRGERIRLSLLACPLLFTTPSFAMIDTPSVKVGFSPEGSASALVLDTINSAESSIRMMAYSFTDPDVMHALAKAKKRGVDVRIVVDDKGNTNRASREAMKYINLLDIPLRTVDVFPIHHDKVIIVDGNTVETGSYNFSRAAARKNSENVVVLKNMPDVAAQYLEHWQDRWNKGTDWRP